MGTLLCYLVLHEPYYILEKDRTARILSLLVVPNRSADPDQYQITLGETQEFGIDCHKMPQAEAKRELLRVLDVWRQEQGIDPAIPLEWIDFNPYDLLVKHG